jgi:hypothetical protein
MFAGNFTNCGKKCAKNDDIWENNTNNPAFSEFTILLREKKVDYCKKKYRIVTIMAGLPLWVLPTPSPHLMAPLSAGDSWR